MNFKPLKNKKEYERTKELHKQFRQQTLNLNNEIELKKLQRKEISSAEAVLWAEIQDYEFRNSNIKIIR